MKNFIVIVLFGMFMSSGISFAQNNNLSLEAQVDSLISVKEFLEKENLSCEDKNRYSNLYYKYFPLTFNRFNSIFGYADFPGGIGEASPLYNESMEYIDLFAEIFYQNHVLYWSRLISLAQGAQWDADAVNILQDYIQLTVNGNAKDFCLFLSFFNDKVVSDFWHFYFDGPHPENQSNDFKNLHIKINKLKPKIAELMKQSYEKLLSEKCISSESITKRVSTLFQIEIEQNYVLSKIDEERFFLALPNNFDEFISFYGRRYQLKDGRRLFLSPDYHYFTLLPNLYYIDKKHLTEKLVQISLNGNFNENRQISSMDLDSVSFLSNLIDATAVFQRSIQLHFASNVATTCQILNNLDDNEVLSFWHFYFYSPHPENYREDFEELQNRFMKYDKRIAQLMKQSYEKLLSGHDGHGH